MTSTISSAGSGSQRWNTPKYRAVSTQSVIDETLFGDDTSKLNGATRRRIVKAPVPPSAVVISAHELLRIKNESIIKTEADLAEEREQAMRAREEKERKARDRIARMKELEKRAAQLSKKSDEEIAAEARKQAIRDAAGKQRDQNSDVVKMLNSMAQRAAAYSIRDQQLEEKHRLAEIEKQIEKRQDLLVEMDRITEIQKREQEEAEKRRKRFDDRKVITEQIEMRERQRMLELEAREQENLAMRSLMKKYEDEDAVTAERRQRAIEQSRLEVIKANEDAIRRKRDAKEAEKKEVEDLLLYQAMKDAELAKREEEEAAIEKAKKERQAKLLAEQERVLDNRGKLDELRARRAAEEKERLERQKEKAEALKRRREMQELVDSRARQAADKAERQRLLKLQEQDELVYQLKYTQQMDERERREREEKERKRQEFKDTLQKQMDEIERLRSRQRNGGDDSAATREALIREEERLKVIRDRMVRDLESQGVNPKYLTEMKHVDIGKILRR